MFSDLSSNAKLLYPLIQRNSHYLHRDMQITEKLVSAIRKDSILDLIALLDDLVAEREKLKKEICEMKEDINKMKREQEYLIMSKGNRKELDEEGMLKLYLETESFRKVGETFGCAGKTVKKRLENRFDLEDEKSKYKRELENTKREEKEYYEKLDEFFKVDFPF